VHVDMFKQIDTVIQALFDPGSDEVTLRDGNCSVDSDGSIDDEIRSETVRPEILYCPYTLDSDKNFPDLPIEFFTGNPVHQFRRRFPQDMNARAQHNERDACSRKRVAP